MTVDTGWWAEAFARLAGIPTAENFGTLVISAGGSPVSFPSIPTSEQLGGITAIWGLDVSMTGIASGEAFGSMKLAAKVSGLGNIASAAASGALTVVPPTATMSGVGGIASGEAFGSIFLANKGQRLKPYIVGATSSATTSVTLPTHAVGQEIYVFAYRNATGTAPSAPSAGGTVPTWVQLEAPGVSNSNSIRLYKTVATTNSHTSGTFTNATSLIAFTVGGQDTVQYGAHDTLSGSSATVMGSPILAQALTDGSSLVAAPVSRRANATTISAAPSGWTQDLVAGLIGVLNTLDSTATPAAMTQAITAAATGYFGAAVEILGKVSGLFERSVGTGGARGFNAGAFSFTHDAVAGDYIVAAAVGDRAAGAFSTPTVNGTRMKPLGRIQFAGSFGVTWLHLWGGYTATDAVTVASSISNMAGYMNSIAYQSVASVGIPTSTRSGSAGSPSQSVTVPGSGVVLQAIGTNGTLSSPSGVAVTRQLATQVALLDTQTSGSMGATSSASYAALALPMSPFATQGPYYEDVSDMQYLGFRAAGTHSLSSLSATAGSKIIVDAFSDRPGAATAATWNGQSLTVDSTQTFTGAFGTGTMTRFIGTASSTATGAVTITVNASAGYYGQSITVKNWASQATTQVNTGAGTPSQTVTSAPGRLTVQNFSTGVGGYLSGGIDLMGSFNVADDTATFVYSSGANWAAMATVFS